MKQREVFWSLLCGAPHRLLRRGKRRHHPLTAGVLVLVLVAQFGCAGSGSDKRSAPTLLFPLPREAFQGLGTVAVTSGRFAPEFDIVGGPPNGAVRGVARGILNGFAVGLMVTVYTFGLGAPFVPLGMVVEGIHGAKAEPTVKVEEREAAIREIVAAQKIQDDLRDRVAAVGRAQTPYSITVLADRGPTAASEQPDYRLLSQEGIQTVIEVVIESVSLWNCGIGCTSNIADPSLTLIMTVKRRLVRTVDNLEIHAKTFHYNSKSGKTLAEWVGDHEGFRNELNQAYSDIAEKTVKELLLRGLA